MRSLSGTLAGSRPGTRTRPYASTMLASAWLSTVAGFASTPPPVARVIGSSRLRTVSEKVDGTARTQEQGGALHIDVRAVAGHKQIGP